MICPYIVTRKSVCQTIIEYDEDGKEVFNQQMNENTAIPIACEKENCGAWRNGRCRYSSAEE